MRMPTPNTLFSSSIFFFYRSGAHRDLHSFPTRRSSDLRRRGHRAASPPGRPERRTRSRGGSSRFSELLPGSFAHRDRKSTRLNSSHSQISYAVFCLKKKNKTPVNRLTRIPYPHCTKASL